MTASLVGSYPLRPGAASNPRASLGVTADHNQANRRADVNRPRSGSTIYSLTPGLGLSNDDWAFALTGAVPFHRDEKGDQQDLDWSVDAAITWKFGGHRH